jgi:hypothetical protein
LIKFSENPKIAKNNENPKKYVFNIFASFLAFSMSSKKEFKFSKVFWPNFSSPHGEAAASLPPFDLSLQPATFP